MSLEYFSLDTEDFHNKLYLFITYNYICLSVVARSLNSAVSTNTVSQYFCFDALSYCLQTEYFASEQKALSPDIL